MTEVNEQKGLKNSQQVKLLKRMVSRFLKLSIANKMRLGFFPMLLLIIIISGFALTKLNQLTSLNETILKIDIPAQEAAKQMREIIIDQESITRRFMILRDKEFIKVFNARSSEFLKTMNSLKLLPTDLEFPLAELDRSYADYSGILLTGIEFHEQTRKATREFDQTIRDQQNELFNILTSISAIAEWDQNEKAATAASIGSLAFKVGLALCVVGILLAAAGAALVTRNIVEAIRKLHYATEMISQGKFEYRPEIKNKDELGDLADAFVNMAERLKNLEEMYLDASPLTRLPGGVAIENILKKKIEADKLFAFCLLDIDNFKSFNDYYGYATGNDMIQNTAAIIEKTAANHGTSEDFIGHIGGDDFVIITTPDRYKILCRTVIEEFDEMAPKLYSRPDRERGHIVGENRQGEKMTFPIATISIAVVTNQHRILRNHIQVGEIAAEIKEHSKSISGSSMVVDQRQGPEIEEESNLLKFPGSH